MEALAIDVVAWNEKRSLLTMQNDDGTLDRATLTQLLDAARDCPYCGCDLNDENKSLDHVTPLIRGGIHGLKNVLVCCLTCNIRKGRRTFEAWLSTLSEPYRANVSRLYRDRFDDAA